MKFAAMFDDPISIFVLEEIVYEILQRLHIRPLFRFKLVSKRWNSIISDPKFGQIYMQRAGSSPKSWSSWHLWGMLDPNPFVDDLPQHLPNKAGDWCNSFSTFPDIDHAPPSLYLPDSYPDKSFFSLDLLSSSNGLLLSCLDTHLPFSYSSVSYDLCVSNPLTKQSVMLPRISFPGCPWTIGFTTCLGQPRESENPAYVPYKVVLILSLGHQLDRDDSIYATIMMFSSDTGSWSCKKLMNCPRVIVKLRQPARVCKGILHWFDQSTRTLVTYDPYNNPERFRRIELPIGTGKIMRNSVVHVYHLGHEDLLKYADVECCNDTDRKFRVWRLVDYAKGEWCLEKRYPISPLWGESLFSDLGHSVAFVPWSDECFCYFLYHENVGSAGDTEAATFHAFDVGSAEEVFGDPNSKLTREEMSFASVQDLFSITLRPWSSPLNGQAGSRSAEVFLKTIPQWLPYF